MKKRKLNKLALLFAISPLTLGGIASCSATKPDQDQVVKFGTIKIKEGITNGSVVTSLTGETEVGKEVEIFAIPNEGYEVDKYFLNDAVLSGDSFTTVEGDNVVFVTFKEKLPETEYGSVQILKDGVTNGKVEAFLEDGTKIDTDNRIQAVGTKVVLKFEGLNECYEIKEVKLNDTVLTVTEGKCEFNVIKGKNFISATFGLIHEGKGLIKLGKEVNNATCSITNLGEYVDVDKDVTVTVTPEANYTVKSVTVNGEEVLESETENTFIFKAKEGLNTIEITVTSVAEGISIVIPEDWIKDDRVTAPRYYVEVGTSFKLDVKFEPEGAYDDLVWSLAYDTDAQYIEVKKDGTINVLKDYYGGIDVKVALKSNPDTSDRIALVPVTSAEFGVATLKNAFKEDKKLESKAAKSNVVLEKKKTSETKATKTIYDFEAFSEGHSVTKVSNDKGMVQSYFFRTIANNTYYAVERDSSGNDKAVEEPTKVTAENKEELEGRVNLFGGAEFVEETRGTTYSGALDFVYQSIFGEYSLYDENDGDKRVKIFDGTKVTKSSEGYTLYTDYTSKLYRTFINSQIKLDLKYNVLYDRIDSVTYERKDYELQSETETLTETTPYELTKITANLTYGTKSEDSNKLFNINDYIYTDFTPIIYSDRENIAGSTLKPNAEGKLELKVAETYYIDVSQVLPETGLDDFNKLQVECDNKEIISYFSSTSNKAKYYFEPRKAGETTITFTAGKIVKTLKVTCSYAKIESVAFSEKMEDTAFINGSIKLEASVNPSKGVESNAVTFSIKEGTNNCEATIKEEVGSYKTNYYLTAPKAGSVTVVATSVGDPTISVEKTFTFKETPNVLSSFANKTYEATWSEFNLSTYGTDAYSYKIAFGEGGTSATILYTIEAEDYYGGKTTTTGNYSATVTQNGTELTLSNLVDLGTSTIEVANLPKLNVSFTAESTLDKLTVTAGSKTTELKESVDVLASLKGKTFKGEDSEDTLTLVFSEADGKIKCEVTYVGGYYTKTTHKFNADVSQKGEKIVLSNLVAVTEGSTSTDLPATSFKFIATEGVVTSLSYTAGDYYEGHEYDVTLSEVK